MADEIRRPLGRENEELPEEEVERVLFDENQDRYMWFE
jgi:hypothetical protein